MNAYNRVDFEFPVAIRASLPSATTCLERPYLLDPLGGRYMQVLLYSTFSNSQTSLPMEIGCLYRIALVPKGPEMDVRIVQALGFNNMEIGLWDTAVQIGCRRVEQQLVYGYYRP